MPNNDYELLTVTDLSELFGCDTETAAARLICGDLPGVKVGRGWIIPRKALFERLNEKAHEEAALRRSLKDDKNNLTVTSKNGATSNANILTYEKSPFMPKPIATKRKRRQPPPLPELPST